MRIFGTVLSVGRWINCLDSFFWLTNLNCSKSEHHQFKSFLQPFWDMQVWEKNLEKFWREINPKWHESWKTSLEIYIYSFPLWSSWCWCWDILWKRGPTDKVGLDFEIEVWNTCSTFVFWIKQTFMQSLSDFFLWQKMVAFKSSCGLYFPPLIVQFFLST